MNANVFYGLLQNAAILLVMVFLLDLTTTRWRIGTSLIRQGILGLVIGLICVTAMMTPWVLVPGVIFDTRSILLGISGLFFGLIPTVVAMLTAGAFRLYLGGAGALTGLIVILSSGLIGILWRRFRRRSLSEIPFSELFLFSLIIHLAMLAAMFSLPWETAVRTLQIVTLPVLAIYPLGTMALGILMVKRLQRQQEIEALRESEERFHSLFNHSIDAVLLTSPDGDILAANPEACRIFARSEKEICEAGRSGLVDISDPRLPVALEERAHTGRFRGELTFIRQDGTRFPGEIASVVFTDLQGKAKTSMIIRDLTIQKEAEKTLKHKKTLLEAINHIFQETLTGKTTQDVARLCLTLAQDLTGSKLGFIGEVNRKGTFDTLAQTDTGWDMCHIPRSHAIKMIEDMAIRGVWGRVILDGQSLLANDPLHHPDWTGLPEGHPPIETFLGVPLLYEGNAIGMIGLANKELEYEETDRETLEALSLAFVEALIRKRAEEALVHTTEQLRRSLSFTVQAISTAVEVKDPYTAGHQRRTAFLAGAIAEKMGLEPERIEFIRLVATIHDIGKISIPSEILCKPTRLTDLEFSLIQMHSQVGHDMLKDIEFPWPVAEVILQHHERMNGSGYPRGLAGEAILLEARILAVADVVESMASDRPYRPALGIEIALEEIEKNQGVFYDPAVAEACLKAFREKGLTLEGK